MVCEKNVTGRHIWLPHSAFIFYTEVLSPLQIHVAVPFIYTICAWDANSFISKLHMIMFNPLRHDAHLNNIKNSVPTTKKTQHISVTKIKWLILTNKSEGINKVPVHLLIWASMLVISFSKFVGTGKIFIYSILDLFYT